MKWKWLQHNEQVLAQQTSEWIEVLNEGTAEEHAAFVEWLKESPRHVREYLLMVALDKELTQLDSERECDVSALLREASHNVVAMDDIDGLRSRAKTLRRNNNEESLFWNGRRRNAALAAGIAAIVAAYCLWSFSGLIGQSFATGIGEQRTVELEDGSIVQLNTNSRLKLSFNAERRDIRLLEGEAIFKVRHDPMRPFRVLTTGAVIQAIGTQFNVYRSLDRTTVSVLEGAVRVSSPDSGSSVKHAFTPASSESPTGVEQNATQLRAGEEASIATGQITKLQTPDVSNSVAWRQRRLVFRADTLEDIVAEFNRYNRAPRVRLYDPALGQRRYTGTFDADDPEAFAMLLAREHDLVVSATASEIAIQSR